MTSSRPAQAAGIITQQIRKTAPAEKESAQPEADSPAPFLPDLCSTTAIAFLVLMGELLALVLVITADGLRPFNWQRLGLVSLTILWVILPSASILCRLRPRLSRLSHPLAAAISYAVVMAVLLVVLGVQHWWQADMAGSGVDYWGLVSNLLVGAICAGVVLRYAFVQQQLHNQQQAELGARIEALQSRIRPHFLFNSMNSLASLIAVDAARAEKLVEDLSALFRASLADSRLVSLDQELVLARRYLEIESLRLGERLQQQWHIDEIAVPVKLPSMLLQPLLENAVLHGVARRRDGGVIRVEVRLCDIGSKSPELLLSIQNPVAASDTESGASGHRGNGIAMDNIRQRLNAFYGPRYRFSAGMQDGDYRVELRLPLDVENASPSSGAKARVEAVQ